MNFILFLVLFLILLPVGLILVFVVKLLDFITFYKFGLSHKASELLSKAGDKCEQKADELRR